MNIKTITDEPNRVFLVKLAVLALVMRFLIGAGYYHFFIAALKNPLYAFDGEAYSIVGWYIALVLKGVNVMMLPAVYLPNDYAVIGGLFGTVVGFGGTLPPIGHYGVGLYSYLIGLFYFVFGYAPVLLRFVMSGLSVATAFVTYRIGRDLFGELAGRAAFVVALFMPSFVIYSASLQRDTLINFLTIFIVYQVFRIVRAKDLRRAAVEILLTAASLIILGRLRINAMHVLTVFVVGCLLLRFAFSYRWVAMTAFGSAIFLASVNEKLLMAVNSKIVLLFNYHLGLNLLGGSTFRILPDSYYRYGDIGSGMSLDSLRPIDAAAGLINGTVAFFIQPSPFVLSKPSQLIVLPQMLAWYLVLMFALVGVYRSFRHVTVEKVSLLALLLLFSVTIGTSEANYETLLRHRDMAVPLYILFAAYGFVSLGRSGREGSGL